VHEVSEIDVDYLYFMDISVEDSVLKFRFIVRHFSLYRMKLIFIDLLAYNLFTCLSLLIIYHIHLNCPRNCIEYILLKTLNHKPYKFIICCLQSMELCIPFVKTVTH
jgi:hypothetical protein